MGLMQHFDGSVLTFGAISSVSSWLSKCDFQHDVTVDVKNVSLL